MIPAGTGYGAPGFSGIDFAVGLVRGVRTWRVAVGVENEGLLEGMFYRQAWLPGVNEAICLTARPPGKVMRSPDGTPVHGKEIGKGHMFESGEKCGFYGYYDGSNDYYTGDARFQNLVTGVVEGFGEVVVGPRGFRCSKARIVALMINPAIPEHDLVMDRYPGIPVFHDFDMMRRAFPEEDGGARAHGPRKDPDEDD